MARGSPVTRAELTEALNTAFAREREITRAELAEAFAREREITRAELAEAFAREREITRVERKQALDEQIDHIQELIRDSQTEVLRGIERMAMLLDTRVSKLESDVTGINNSFPKRLALLEERVFAIEHKLMLGGASGPSVPPAPTS